MLTGCWHSIWFSTSSYSFKLESDCKFCNEVTSSCDHHVTFVRLSDWPSDLTSYFTHTYCHTMHQWKYLEVKYITLCLNLKLIAEGILRYFSNKSTFDDKLKVSCLAGIDTYLICMHWFETNTCIFGHNVEFHWCVVWHVHEQITSL